MRQLSRCPPLERKRKTSKSKKSSARRTSTPCFLTSTQFATTILCSCSSQTLDSHKSSPTSFCSSCCRFSKWAISRVLESATTRWELTALPITSTSIWCTPTRCSRNCWLRETLRTPKGRCSPSRWLRRNCSSALVYSTGTRKRSTCIIALLGSDSWAKIGPWRCSFCRPILTRATRKPVWRMPRKLWPTLQALC